ncbi:unnamed protein product [Rhizoctonia solani]|uniref:Protein kinase domain-containing protein n=1 Tax=Rhizoctonia solani TaxID=456999 RepID=A0A8H3B1B1_9AGAM|nr:unnamed protein product [Rhizoctonia solani]
MDIEKATDQSHRCSSLRSSTASPLAISDNRLIANDQRDTDKSSDTLDEKSIQVNDLPSLHIPGPLILPIDVGRDEHAFTEGGWEGWLVVAGCFLIGAPTVGWNLLWGVFQAYHSAHLLQGTPDATISLIGASQNAGVLQGIGCGLTLPMVFALPSQWFKKNRGLATGVVIAGAALGGAVSSLIIQAMLVRMSLQMTLFIYSFVQGGIMLMGCLLIKTRSPPLHTSEPVRKRIQWVDTMYFKDPVFWSCWFAFALFVLGYQVPLIFISVYIRDTIPSTTPQLATLPISIMNFSSAVGRTTVGLVADQIGFVNAFILTAMISAFSQGVLWNLTTHNYAGVIVFSIIFGLTGPCYVSLTTPIAATLYGTQSLATLTGLLNIASLPGALGGPPIGGYILKASGRNWHILAGYSGAVQFAGVLCVLYDKLVEREGSRWAELDFDNSRPIRDMVGIIQFQRDVGDRAWESEDYSAAFSHYSRSKYVFSKLHGHPGFNVLSEKETRMLHQTVEHINEKLPTIANLMFQPAWESSRIEESSSDQTDTDDDDEYSPRDDPRLGSNGYNTYSAHPDNMQPSPSALIFQPDHNSRVPIQPPIAYSSPHSTNPHERSFHDDDHETGLASSFLQLNINPPQSKSSRNLFAPQAQMLPTYSDPHNRGLTSPASSRGPPRARGYQPDTTRPRTASGDYYREIHNPPVFANAPHPSRPESPREYYTAPIDPDALWGHNLSGQSLGPIIRGPSYLKEVGSGPSHIHHNSYSGSRYGYNPAHDGHSGSRTRNLSAVNLSRNLPPATEILQRQPNVDQFGRHLPSARISPSRKRSLSDSANYPPRKPNTSSMDSMDYYTANMEFVAAFRQTETSTFAQDMEDDHPHTIDSLEKDAVSQMEQANWQQAEILLTDVLERRRHVQGDSHLHTIQSMSNLGWAYQGQGTPSKLRDAVDIFNVALRELRKNDPETNWRIGSDIRNRLKITREKQGDLRDYAYSSRAPDTSTDNVAAASSTNSFLKLGLRPMISANTTPDEVMTHLTSRGCPNLTNNLDPAQCTEVSKGGYGDIWHGVIQFAGKPKYVALKRLREEKKMYKHLCYELYTWSKTNHPNVLDLLGIAWFKNRLVMVSPWMHHGNIEEYLKDNPQVDRFPLVLQVVQGVDYLHKVLLVHGDLKARNVFVSNDGVVKIGDFGLAKLLGEQSLGFSISGNHQFGTVRWMAPELLVDTSPVDYPSDIYALGMTLLEIITSKVPFHELQPTQVIFAVMNGQRPRYSWDFSTLGERGRQLWAIICCCWDPTAQKRPSAPLVLQQVCAITLFYGH